MSGTRWKAITNADARPNNDKIASKPIVVTQEVKKPIAEQAGEGGRVSIFSHPIVKNLQKPF